MTLRDHLFRFHVLNQDQNPKVLCILYSVLISDVEM